FAACSANSGSDTFQEATGASDNSGGQGGFDLGLGGHGAGAADGGILMQEPKCVGVDPNIDNDGDGWTGAQGDGNDCTNQMYPGAQDYRGNSIDEDCNGGKDDNPTNCVGASNLASTDPIDGAKAMGLCKVAQGDGWGLVSAQYVTADGQPLDQYD